MAEDEKQVMTEDEKTFKLLELSMSEEQYFLKEHQGRVNFFTSLISSLIVLTIAGLLNAKEPIHYFALAIGPLLIILIAIIAIRGTKRLYQRFLESITVQAKIQQKLKTTADYTGADALYWKNEPLILRRYIKDCSEYETSKEFVEKKLSKGYNKWTRSLFQAFLIIGSIMMVSLIIIGVCKTINYVAQYAI